ncbi:MAG: PIN domain nuclease [uncultured Sulfurovum sp.]|uniref:PIN domain nuclease n=1 Tax=uncultured Sulfurovum sp. TaxID=269237 RepID=A0A6S6SX56_9BACT|nr:MAG: PIN domain nuclease [uncultured Sulfurovum sp.]
MVSLIDTNVIIRFLAADVEKLHLESVEIFNKIYNNELKVEILGEVIVEVLFVMKRGYRELKDVTVASLKEILSLRGVVNHDKYILLEALTIFCDKNIDFVDALICTKSKLEGYGKISFDKDVMKKCEK